jgi:hypothetical protein
MQFSFWLRNSILAGSSSSEHGNSSNNTSNNTHHYRTTSTSTTTQRSLPPEYDTRSDETNGTTDWIVQPQNIDEVLLCFYNGKSSSTTQQQPPVSIDWMEEELNLGYDWILDGECDIAPAAEDGKQQQPTVASHSSAAAATTNSSSMQLTLDRLSLEEEDEEDAQQLDSSTPSLRHQQRREQEKPRLFINSHLVKLLPLTDTETNKTPLHKFARTSQLLMIQELERRQKSLGALEEENSLLSHSSNDNSAIPRIIQCFPDTEDDDDHSITPSPPFTLNSDQTLPLHFYHQGYDPVAHLLQSMPRGRSSKKCTVATADNFITQLLSRADEYQTTIKAELNSLIGSRKADIQQGIQQLQNIDREIGASLLHWNQARYYVDSARRQTFLQESLTLIQNSLLRTKYKQLLKALDECNDIIALEKQLNSLISLYTSDDTAVTNTTNSFNAQWKPHSVEDYQKFLSMENDLKARAFSSINGLGTLQCFSKLRQRTSTILTTTVGTLLFKELSRILSTTCQTNELSNSQYSTLLQVSIRATIKGRERKDEQRTKKDPLFCSFHQSRYI